MAHRGNTLCTATWGTCDERSDQPPYYLELPHICGEDRAKHPIFHYCEACRAPQV